MNFIFTTASREGMTAFGFETGVILREEARPGKAWVVTLGADHNSGKSLFALAIDCAFRPVHYPHGIHGAMDADARLNPRDGGLPVIFRNFFSAVQTRRAGFDRELELLALRNPAAKVCVASNLKRLVSANFNYAARGLQSDRLDMNFDFIRKEGWEREIGVTTENTRLCQHLACLPRRFD